jgi:SAM-dependent methyltransferase
MSNGLRPDLALIADWVAPGSQVLDLGCGDGALLAYLQAAKGCRGYGVEINDAQVLACLRAGVDVIQQDIEAGLGMFHAPSFDVVVLSMAIQMTHQTERVLREMSEVGGEGIVSLPNFGHWSHPWAILRGRMPVSRELARVPERRPAGAPGAGAARDAGDLSLPARVSQATQRTSAYSGVRASTTRTYEQVGAIRRPSTRAHCTAPSTSRRAALPPRSCGSTQVWSTTATRSSREYVSSATRRPSRSIRNTPRRPSVSCRIGSSSCEALIRVSR